MNAADTLTELLVRYGPPLLGGLTLFETATLAGLFVPAGVAFLIAVFLATQGTFSVAAVVAWALGGALLGDSIGYWIGRQSQPTEQRRRGLLGRALAKIGPRKLALLAGAPLYSVSMARVVSFLRTLAPMAAGASGLTYARFLVYNVFGIALWAGTYVAVGTLAGESWNRVGQYVGAAWGGVFVVALAVGVWVHRRRQNAVAARQPFSVGLTGNAASGKSTVAGLWRGQGVPVVDADVLAREAVLPGSRGLASVVELLGEDVLIPEGGLDRAKVRALVFADEAKRKQLEAILHPHIADLRAEWIAAQAEEGHLLVVSEIPLLFEVGLDVAFDAVVLVHSPHAVSRTRLVETRGLSPEDAEAILGAQMPSESKIEKSDFVIRNEASAGDLEDAAMHVLGQLREQAKRRRDNDPSSKASHDA